MPIFDASAWADELPLAALAELDAALADWFLIGAFARDVVVHMAAGLPRSTVTHDVDIAVAAADDEAYRSIVAPLRKSGGGRIRHRAAGYAVDVIAYGGVAPGDELVDESTTLDVTGLADAARSTIDVRLAPDLVIRSASLHAQVVLKIVAWQARGRTSTRDARDLALLLDASHQGGYEAEVWSDETALAAGDHLPDLAGPFRTGSLIRRDFAAAVTRRVADQLEPRAATPLVEAMVGSPVGRRLAAERLDALRRGLVASTDVHGATT